MYSTSELDELFQILNSIKGLKLDNHIGATQQYYPWINENELISGLKTYEDSYKHKQHLIQEVANKFNEDCELFDVSVNDMENDTMQFAWNLVAPLIAQDDAITLSEGCSTLQQHSYYNRRFIWNKGSHQDYMRVQQRNNLCISKTIVKRSDH